MRLKYIVILILMILLAFTVVQMMKFESSIREGRKVTLYVEDDTKPLITNLSEEEIRDAALKAEYYFMARENYFSQQVTRFEDGEKKSSWEDLFLKGVNLGVAVPGKFPGEFSLTFDKYLEWMKLIGKMNANIIRTYTILPPAFYQAFSYYNFLHSDKPIFLMQGVWAEVPKDEDYFNPGFTREFQKEIIDAVNVIHGRDDLKELPGKASGIYSSDVSRYVVGILLGREWEPKSVFKTNQVNHVRQYKGEFVCMNDGNSMEVWLAGMMDFAVLYETQTYGSQHPVSFVNWLPLDPMYHSTEIIENHKIREYDNDLESIDFSRFHATELFSPGIFAAYHAYPYYPDFIYLQSSYTEVTGSDNRSDPYLGYLKDLKAHTPGMPLVIAEYGLPSSRGNSHVSPYGMNQGGHSEAEQARLSLTLTDDIVKSGCAGAVYFEWIDEWFKQNWLVMDFELPADDRRLWHNMENPEQNFGILALEDKNKKIDGELNDWDQRKPTASNIEIMTDADATYFYLALKIPELDFNRKNLFIALDTYDKEKGDHKLPFTTEKFENGFEFLLEFKSADSAAILVDEPYSVYTDIYNDLIPGYASVQNENGVFIREKMLTNRGRVSLLGVKTDSVAVDRSRLTFGISSNPEKSNADWYFNKDKGILEARIPWHLINVTDPAKRYVLDNKPGTSDIEYAKSDAFNLFIFLTDKKDKLLLKYPENTPFSCTWDEWETPKYSSRLKPVYFTLQDYFRKLNVPVMQDIQGKNQQESFSITDFMYGKKNAVSISFDNAGYSQYSYALPILGKYYLSATFGIDPEMMKDAPGMVRRDDDGTLKRLGLPEVRELAATNEIAFQSSGRGTVTAGAVTSLENKTHTVILTMNGNRGIKFATLPGTIIFYREKPEGGLLKSSFCGIPYTAICAGLPVTSLDSILLDGKDQWTILIYHHIYEQPNEIPQQVNTAINGRLFLPRAEMEKQVRLIRNRNYWIAPEGDVYRYLKEKKAATLITQRFKNMIFLKVNHSLDRAVYDLPLTVEYKTNARTVRIEGSLNDGTYQNRNGSILFNVKPDNEVKIEIIE
jgi:hypothetical protein